MILNSLKNKLMFAMVIIITFMGVLATYSVFLYSKNVISQNEKDSLTTIVSEQTQQVYLLLEQSTELSKIISQQDFIVNYLNNEEKEKQDIDVLNKFESYNINNTYSSIYLLNPDGTTLVSTDESFVSKNYSFRDYFKKAIAGENYTDISIGVTSKELGYYFSTPVKDDNRIIGVLVLKMRPDTINELIVNPYLEINREKIGLLTMIDNYGVIFHSNDETKLFKSVTQLDPTILSEIKEKNKFADYEITTLNYDIRFEEIDSEKEIFSTEVKDKSSQDKFILNIVKINKYPFRVMLVESESKIIAEAVSISYTLGLFVLLAVIITLIIVNFLIIHFTKPIYKLSKDLEIIESGNLDYKVGTKAKDEIGQLSRTFDRMISAVKKSRVEIDRKVKEQTSEITEKQKNLENQQIAMLNILEDVQEEKDLKEIETKKIATIIESIGDGVFVIDNNHNIIVFNQTASKISGFSEKEALGKNYKKILKFIFEKDGKINDKFIKDAIRLGSVQEMTNHTLIVKKDGTKIPVADSSSPIKDADGNVIGCVVVFRDVTKEREVDQLKSDFVSIASHQLRTPLTGIRWVSERLLKNSKTLPKKEREYVDDINLSTKKLSRLVDDLLNVSRIEGGNISIKPQEINLNEFINSYIEETRPLITKKNIDFTFKNELKKQEVYTDPSALRNIIQSLVSNAIEYTPQNGKVFISLEKSKTKGNFLIKIKDTGIGIPPKNQATIFEKFTRGDNAQQMKTDGTGFGLFITKQTVEMLKGEIRFESILDKGTTFYVTLPIKSETKAGEKSFV